MATAQAAPLSTKDGAPSGFLRWLMGPWPIVLFFFFATFLFTTWDNQLPYYYEKDAPSKVRQVVSGDRNFFHPLLMLNTADVFLTMSGAERTHQNAAVAGRTAIALFTSLGVAAFAMMAWRMEGRGAAIVTGGLLLTCPLLFELSHIFKEDPALIVGLGFGFLAMQMFWTNRSTYQAGWMGAAAAIAISGKYVGVAVAIMGVVLLIMVSKDRTARNGARWLAYIASLLVTLSVVNYQLIANLSTFAFGFRTEMADLTRKDKIDDIPHVKKVATTIRKFTPPAAALAFAAFALHTLIRRRREPVRWMLFLYPLVFTVILAYSPRLFTRHFLPVIVMTNVVAGIGIVLAIKEIINRFPMTERRRNGLIAFSSLVLFCIIYVRDYHKELINYNDVFANPTREVFIREAIRKLPPDAVIATDSRVFLVDRNGKPRERDPVEQKVLVASRLAHFGSIEQLHELGVTHVAVHGIDSRYIFKKDRRIAESDGGTFEERPPALPHKKKRKSKYDPALYDELIDRARLLYSIRGKGSAYNAPALRLYKLPPPAGAAAMEKASNPTSDE